MRHLLARRRPSPRASLAPGAAGRRPAAPAARRALLLRRVLALALAARAAFAAAAVAAPPYEYEVKAAFLYNFAQFVEWPPGALAEGDEGRLCVGVLGGDPFGPDLDRTLAGKTVRGRLLEIRRFADLAEIEPCHVLFVGALDQADLRRALAALAGRSVLTVGETPAFAQEGGMITFTIDGGRVRFHVNAGAAERAGLRISSRLLHLATTVRGGRHQGGP